MDLQPPAPKARAHLVGRRSLGTVLSQRLLRSETSATQLCSQESYNLHFTDITMIICELSAVFCLNSKTVFVFRETKLGRGFNEIPSISGYYCLQAVNADCVCTLTDMYVTDVTTKTTATTGCPTIVKETVATALVDGNNVLGKTYLLP